METFGMVGFIFGIMGMVFGLLAWVQVLELKKKLDCNEKTKSSSK